MLTDSPRLYPGVTALVQALRGRLRLAVVTGTWRANVEAVLRASGLEDAFELIVAKEDVTASQARSRRLSPGPEAAQAQAVLGHRPRGFTERPRRRPRGGPARRGRRPPPAGRRLGR